MVRKISVLFALPKRKVYMNLFYADVCIVYVCYVLRYVLLFYLGMNLVWYLLGKTIVEYLTNYKSNQNCELRSF